MDIRHDKPFKLVSICPSGVRNVTRLRKWLYDNIYILHEVSCKY